MVAKTTFLNQFHTAVDSKTVKSLFSEGLLLFAFFFALYLSVSFLLSSTSAFEEYDVLFEIDTPRVIGDMANVSANHSRTNVHPLYVLLVNPIGSLFAKTLSSTILASISLNSFLGAIGVVLGFVTFWQLTNNITVSFLLASMFGLSASQFYLSAIPDTASLAICSLICTYAVFIISLRKRTSSMVPWTVAGIFSFAVTITNFFQTLLCFAAYNLTVPGAKCLSKFLFNIAKLALAVVLVTSAFSFVQKAIYPSTQLFFLPETWQEDFRYASFLILSQPSLVIFQLVKHFWGVNIVAPFPTVFQMNNHEDPAITFSTSSNFNPIGWIAIILWTFFLVTGIVRTSWSSIKEKDYTFVTGLVLCLLFNLMLHSIYGTSENGKTEFFIYTGNFTFLILLICGKYILQTNI